MLDTALRFWFIAGLLSLLVPGAVAHNHYIGWLPYWLCLAPAVSLALLHRHRLVAASSAFLVRARRRRKPLPRQALRLADSRR